MLGVCDSLGLADCERDWVTLGESDEDWVTEGVRVPLWLRVCVDVSEGVSVTLLLGDSVAEGVFVSDGVAEGEGVPDGLALGVSLRVIEFVWVREGDCVVVVLGELLLDPVCDAVSEGVGSPLLEVDEEPVHDEDLICEALCDWLWVACEDALCEALIVDVSDVLGEPLGVDAGDDDEEEVWEAVALQEEVSDAVSLCVTLAVDDWLLVWDCVGEVVAVPLGVSDSVTEAVAVELAVAEVLGELDVLGDDEALGVDVELRVGAWLDEPVAVSDCDCVEDGEQTSFCTRRAHGSNVNTLQAPALLLQAHLPGRGVRCHHTASRMSTSPQRHLKRRHHAHTQTRRQGRG